MGNNNNTDTLKKKSIDFLVLLQTNIL